MGVTSAWMGSNTAYASASGTSMASPHVAGLVGVLLGCGVALTNDDVAQVLHTTAKDLDSPLVAGVLDGRDTWFGYGLMQAQNATTAISCQPGAGGPPSPTATASRTPTRTSTPQRDGLSHADANIDAEQHPDADRDAYYSHRHAYANEHADADGHEHGYQHADSHSHSDEYAH